MTAIQGKGGTIWIADEPLPSRKPVDEQARGQSVGHVQTQAETKRVRSVKLNRPKLASSISHFIAALIHLASGT